MKSLTYDFNLICDNIQEKLSSQTIMLFSSPFGLLFNLIFTFSPKIRKFIIIVFLEIIGLFCVFPVFFFQKSLRLISISASIIFFSMVFNLSHYYSYFNEFFKPEIAKILPLFCLTSYGAFSLIYILLDIIFQGNWKILFLIYGIIDIIIGIALIFIKDSDKEKLLNDNENNDIKKNESDENDENEENEENKEKNEKLINFNIRQIAFALKDRKICKNTIILIITYCAIMYFTFGIFLDISNLGGNFFINYTFLCLSDTIGNIISGVFIVNFNIYRSLKVCTLGPGIFLFLYIFIPYTEESRSNFLLVFLTLTAIFSKLIIAITYNFFIVLLSFVLSPNLISFFITFSLLICRIPISLLPVINYFLIKKFNLYSFVVYGFLFILSYFLLIFFLDVKEENCIIDEETKKSLTIDDIPLPSVLISMSISSSFYSGKNQGLAKKISGISKTSKMSFELEKF